MMRNLEETISRWNLTFSNNANLSDLRVSVRNRDSSNPCDDGLRSVCWKAFLVFENLDQSTWPKTIRDSRSAYASLKEHFKRNAADIENRSTDPLADDANSPWNTLRRDELLRAEISQDVERCMPDNPYFREEITQDMMLEVLFVYCKLNADVGYRQGMHELLAPVLWVVTQDAMDPGTFDEAGNDGISSELMQSVLNSKFIEHDVFTLFCIIMQTAKSFYEIASNSQSSATRASENSPIIERSKRIHEDLLQRTDRKLANHLASIDILPQIFVIRWIRLLFGREFAFDDVLILWDVLFAEDPALNLVDLICVAMLLRIRWELLEADYSSALTILLRYPVPPAPNGPITFVEDALYLRENLNVEGGGHLILKYSGRTMSSEHTPARPALRRPLHTPRNSQDFGRSKSPLRSPSQLLGDTNALENMLQDAARGAFKQGEKLGSSLRGALQQLQQANLNGSPRRSLGTIRWPIDNHRTPSSMGRLETKIRALEERNKSLANMLHESIEELSTQAKGLEGRKAESDANALTLSIARLQYIHVYLENSAMPLHFDTEQPDAQATPSITAPEESKAEDEKKQMEEANGNGTSAKETDSEIRPREASPGHISTSPTRSKPVRRRPPTTAPKAEGGTAAAAGGSQFHQSRPSLAESSYSWMLGDDREKSSFVSASPFAPEQTRAKPPTGARSKKTGFLFGDNGGDDDDLATKWDRKHSDAKEDEDGFTMGTLRGGGG